MGIPNFLINWKVKRISFELKSHQNYHSELYQPTYICLLVFRPNARRWYTLHSTIRCANSMSSRSKCVWFHLEITRTVHTSVNRGQSRYYICRLVHRHYTIGSSLVRPQNLINHLIIWYDFRITFISPPVDQQS